MLSFTDVDFVQQAAFESLRLASYKLPSDYTTAELGRDCLDYPVHAEWPSSTGLISPRGLDMSHFYCNSCIPFHARFLGFVRKCAHMANCIINLDLFDNDAPVPSTEV